MLGHNVQSLFLGTFSMGLATIVNIVSVLGPEAAIAAWYLWWIDVLVSVVIAVGVPFMMFVALEKNSITD
jgi:tellurite resistance protein TehA-like permease